MLKKKLLSLIMALSMLTAGVVFAEEDSEADAPEGAYVILNGAEEVYYEDICAWGMLKYTDIASLAGYTTTYDADTRTITSVNGDDKVVISLDTYNPSHVILCGKETPFYARTQIINGRLYVDEWYYTSILDVKTTSVYDDETDTTKVYVNSLEPLRERVREKTANLQKYLSIAGPEKFPHVTASGKIDTLFEAPNFGTTSKGSCNIDTEMKYSGDKMYVKINGNTDGIYNALNIALQSLSKYASNLEDRITAKLDLKQPLDFELYCDEKSVYCKSTLLNGLLLSGIADYTNTDKFKEDLSKNTKDKFIRYDADDYLLPYDLDEIITNPIEILAESFAEAATNLYLEYDEIISFIDASCALYDENHMKITEKPNGDADIIYTMTADDIANIIKSYMADSAADPSNESFLKMLDSLKLNCIQTIQIADGKMTSKSDIDVSVVIPGMWGIDIGTLTAKLTSEGVSTSLSEEIKEPDAMDSVNYDSLLDASQEDSQAWYNAHPDDVYYDAEYPDYYEDI